MKVFLILIVFFYMTSSLLGASEVVLKSGQRIEGKIIEKTERHVKIYSRTFGIKTFYTDEIDAVDGQKLQQENSQNTIDNTKETLNQAHQILSNSKQPDMGTGYAMAGLAINEADLIDAKLMSYKSYPGYKKALDEAMTDPEFKKAWEAKDVQVLQNNLTYKNFYQNSDVQETVAEAKRLQAEGEEDIKHQLAGTPYENLRNINSVQMPVLNKSHPDIEELTSRTPSDYAQTYVGKETLYTLKDGTQIKGKFTGPVTDCREDVITPEGKVFRLRNCAEAIIQPTEPGAAPITPSCSVATGISEGDFQAKLGALYQNTSIKQIIESDPAIGMYLDNTRALRTTKDFNRLMTYPEFSDYIRYMDQLTADCSP